MEFVTFGLFPYSVIGLIFLFLSFFQNQFFASILIGKASVYRFCLVLVVYESCRSVFNLILWTLNLTSRIHSKLKLPSFIISFKPVLFIALIGIPLLGLPFELICLLAMYKYFLSKRDQPQLSLLIACLPFIIMNVLVWIKHEGWENSYSLQNHLLGLLYASAFYDDGPQKYVLFARGRRWQHLLSYIFGWISFLIGWQHPYACYHLVHIWTAQRLSCQILGDYSVNRKNG